MEKLILEPVKVPWKLSASDEIEIFRSDSGAVELLLIADLINDHSKKSNIQAHRVRPAANGTLRHPQYSAVLSRLNF